MNSWPFDGRLYSAARSPTVIFVPHFGGTRATSRRHRVLVNELGYHAFAFNLGLNVVPSTAKEVWAATREDMVARWSRELECVCEAIEGPKVIYSFSFPSISFAAMMARKRRRDVVGWICDGGPFFNLWGNFWKLRSHEYVIANPAQRLASVTLGYMLMRGPLYAGRALQWMEAVRDVPTLSIRSGHDLLVPEATIDRLFEGHSPKRVLIPEAGHLQGLKVAPDTYGQAVSEFLTSVTGPG